MSGEIIVSKGQEDRELEFAPDQQLPAVHPSVDPALALPSHLQTIAFEDDMWRRMTESKLRHPALSYRSLRENPDQRDLLRAALAAASEREKEVLLHGQARAFTQMLYSAARSVRSFLNEPLVPDTWKRSETDITPEADSGGTASKDADRKSREMGTGGLKGLLVFLLTPKIFLTVIALGFGVLAGYSQIQVRNLSSTIETYEQALNSLKANNEALEGRISNFDEIAEEGKQKLDKQFQDLIAAEQEANKLRAQNSGLSAKIEGFERQIGDLQRGKEATASDLEERLAKANTDLGAAREASARMGTEISQLRTLLETQGTAGEAAAGERDKMADEVLELKTELARKDIQLSNARRNGTLLGFAERALKDIRFLAERYSTIDDDHVMEHIGNYETRKDRFLR